MKYDEKYLNLKTLIIIDIVISLDSLLVGLTFSVLPFYKTFLYTIEIRITSAIIIGLGFMLGNKSHFLGVFFYF